MSIPLYKSFTDYQVHYGIISQYVELLSVTVHEHELAKNVWSMLYVIGFQTRQARGQDLTNGLLSI